MDGISVPPSDITVVIMCGLKTSAERIVDTLVWYPTHIKMPTMSLADAIIAAANDLTTALNHST